MDDETSVRVALRIRPQIAREKIEMCRVCTTVTPGEPQVVLGTDKAFTFDHVFDIETEQEFIYKSCVSQLLEGCFDGYNATVLAYGQTGSGKTYTMGTGFEVSTTTDLQGIIPRAVQHIFDGITRRKSEAAENGSPEPFFQVGVQFIELYKEEILDLLDPTRDVEASRACKSNIKIHEDHQGNIYMTDVVSRSVTSAEETINVLRNGALTRTTAKTNMNAQSSRSHAIFTIHISQQRFLKQDNGGLSDPQTTSEFETLTAKFHFVDLAGSERLKRTGATGLRAEEGININCGLLALGNVISALGDANRKVSHVPYRDSKLTRLLQDSLGGNSRTTMIACISPSDCDFLETLNTLKYANRARNIKNKVVVNQDRSSRVISELRARIQALELELAEYKQGKRIATSDGGEAVNDMYHENTLLQTELNQLRLRVKALQESQDVLRARNADILCEMETRLLKAHHASENGGQSEENGENGNAVHDDPLKLLIRKYLEEIEDLRSKLCESESACGLLRQQISRYKSNMQNQQRLLGGDGGFGLISPNLIVASSPNGMIASVNGGFLQAGSDELAYGSVSPLVDAAKADIEKLKAKSKEISNSQKNGNGTHENGSEVGVGMDDNEVAPVSDTEDDNEESESESDEKEEEFGKYRQDLADLQCEISLKERLVDELVQSHKRLQAVRMQYEEKLTQLQLRIQDTETERDRVLAALEKQKSSDDRPDANAAKVRKDYEERICSLRNEMKRLQVAQREHQRLTREQQQNQAQISRLSVELQEMKKTKVLLMQKMKEESSRTRAIELKRQKEVAQLQKEARRRENELRELKMKEQRREAIFKRKQEEMQNLRRSQRPVSTRGQQPNQTSYLYGGGTAAERTPLSSRTTIAGTRRRSTRVLSRLAKQHWNNIEKAVMNQVVKKQTISQMEQELERCMQNRDDKRRKLETLRQKKSCVLETAGIQSAPMDKSVLADIDDQIESVQANIDYLQDSIAECQKQIMEVEEGTKEESESQEQGGALFDNCQNLDEAKYLLEHLYNLCVSQGSLAAQKQATLKETEIKLQQTQQEFQVHQKLLQHLVSNNPEACGLPENMASSVESMSGSVSIPIAPLQSQLSVEEKMDDQFGHVSIHQPIQDRAARDKARRRTATPEELLYSESFNADIRPPLNVVFELDDFKSDDDSIENSKAAGGSRTRDCSPEDVGRASSTVSSKVTQNNVGRSLSCVEVGNGVERSKLLSDQKLMPPPPLPPKKHQSETSTHAVLSRSNATKRRNVAASTSISESDCETFSAPATMTVSDTVVPLRRAMTVDENVEQQPQVGSASSLYPASFSRGLASRNTIAGTLVTDNTSNRKTYGFRSYATKNSSSDLHMKKPSSVVAPSPMVSSMGAVASASSSSINTGVTPPASPRFLRRQVGHMNVFTRLAASAGIASSEDTGDSDSQSQGVLYEYEKAKGKGVFRNNLLTCAYVAEGHTKAVLTVAASDVLMATGSKDRTVKVWDLEKGVELATLANHPNNVQCVRLHPTGNVLYSVSMGHVKVWDLRSMNCVKTLSSSGLTIDGEFSPGGGLSNEVSITSSRQTTLAQNEAMIAQIELTPNNDYLMTAAYNQVRIWDLRNYNAVGKLANATSTPKSDVSCMRVIPSSTGFRVAAGSRDHFIKVFNLASSTSLHGSFEPYQQLDPPHYDGVTCLASYGDDGRWLFSGSRDQCLVKWDLANGGRRVQPLSKVHKAWILSLTFLQAPYDACLVSACREGSLRLWDANTCQSLGNFLAHSSAVNCLTTNNGFVFTASNDNTVGIWKPRDDLLNSVLTSASKS